MTLSELCIRRPVFTTMLITLPVVLGIMAYGKMGVDLFPNVDLPIVTITTSRANTSVEEMETGVTKLLEEAVNTISGVDELRSTTKEGVSVVVIQFMLEKNRDVAYQEVQGKVNTVLSRLPSGTDAPIIDKFDIDASPVMTIAISSTTPAANPTHLARQQRQITEIADKQIKDSLSSLPGVGSVALVGGRKRAVQVTVNTDKLEAQHLSIEQVRQALINQNLELPGGRVDQGEREPILRTMGRVTDPRQFRDIIVANIGGQPVRIRDIGQVEDDVEEPRSLGRLDQNAAVLLIVQKQSGTNTVAVIETVKKRLGRMGGVEPEAAANQGAFVLNIEGHGQLKADVIRDQSRFINASLHEVKKHLVLGALLVSLTILLFLRDWRTMVMASIAIPVSLIATFMVMSWMNFTLNNISMLALVLAVGIVIDDAVVVHENIFRWMEEKGFSAWDAAMNATREITLAVVATTLSLVVIFLPIAFMSGRVGRFFFSFGVTSAVAIMASMLVSFTLTPMLCSRFLKLSEKARKAGAAHHSGGFYGWFVERPYLWTLRWSLRRRWAIVLMTIIVTASIFPLPMGKWLSMGNPDTEKKLARLNYPGLFGMVGFSFLPTDDQSEFEIALTTPAGWTLDRVDQTCREIETQLHSWPQVVNVLTTIGETTGKAAKGQGDVTQASLYVRLVDLKDRKKKGLSFTQFEVMGRARRLMADYPDIRSSVQIPAAISAGTVNAEVEFTLVGPDLAKLNIFADSIISTLRRNPGLADVDTTLALRKPELRVTVDRDRASDLGVSIQSIAATLRTLVGGQIATDFKDNQLGELYDVWLRADHPNRTHRQVLENLTIPSTKVREAASPATSGSSSEPRLIRLTNVAGLGEDRGPAQIDRFARTRKISIVCNLAGAATSDAVKAFQDAAAALNDGQGLPPEYQLIASGRAKTQAESNVAFLMAFALSLVFMYIILAAQFESFVHPITILLAVPLTIPFALLSLIFLGEPLTIYSILGVFLLFGIVKKNGILQVDYSNVLRHRADEGTVEVPRIYRDGRDSSKPSAGGNGDQLPESRQPDSPVAPTRGWWPAWVRTLSPDKRVRTWAVMESNRTRLRPILMTTLMLVAGMIPLAMGEGPGSGSRAAMAKVIVGGQAMSLLLTLLVTPIAYTLFDDLSLLWRRKHTAPTSGRRREEGIESDAVRDANVSDQG